MSVECRRVEKIWVIRMSRKNWKWIKYGQVGHIGKSEVECDMLGQMGTVSFNQEMLKNIFLVI